MNLECAILNILTASPRALPVSVITPLVPGFTGSETTQSAVVLALRSLERKGHVNGTPNEDTGTKWKETDDGRLRIS